MLIRTVPILLLTIAACADTLDTQPGEATTDQASLACDLHFYRCYPNRPGSLQTCEMACGETSHCRDYSVGEYIWCEVHPAQCLGGFRCCDPWGNPAWDTVCVPGATP
jgi:hypothetical protein